MATRCISGLLGGLVVIAILFLDSQIPIMMNVLISLACSLSILELFASIGIKKTHFLTISSVVFSALLPFVIRSFFQQILWYVYTLVTVAVMIFAVNFKKTSQKEQKIFKFKDVFVIYSLTVLISFAMVTLIRLRDLGGSIGSFYAFVAIGISWLSDTFAYFGGNLFGKKKLCPDISPKKTIEGFVSGTISSVVIMLLIAIIFQNAVQKVSICYLPYIIMCLVGSLVSVMGDLCFSLLKRNYGLKDFGNSLPGHGGVLDRFDSLIFVAPFVYFVLKCFPRIILGV